MFPERLFTFIKVRVSNILHIQCITTITSQQMDISSIGLNYPEKKRNIVSLNSMITIEMKIKY